MREMTVGIDFGTFQQRPGGVAGRCGEPALVGPLRSLRTPDYQRDEDSRAHEPSRTAWSASRVG